MQKAIITLFCILSFHLVKAQATQYNGSWALCKIVSPSLKTL
jgi:hypothetical protein